MPELQVMCTSLTSEIDRNGFAVLQQVFDRAAAEVIIGDLHRVLEVQTEAKGSIRSSNEVVYAARNLLEMWPRSLQLAQERELRSAIIAVLGPGCGLVRALFFDKPPGRSWCLPWHRDKTIAVRDNSLPSSQFSKPTWKAGVPHVEAPVDVLHEMLTARIHLDDATDENGPLMIVSGSHREGPDCALPTTGVGIQAIHAMAGDVLLMRPLLVHSSKNSREGTPRHRRIVHLEVASSRPLPDGYEWHDFRPLSDESSA